MLNLVRVGRTIWRTTKNLFQILVAVYVLVSMGCVFVVMMAFISASVVCSF